jgi:hypothetical protein
MKFMERILGKSNVQKLYEKEQEEFDKLPDWKQRGFKSNKEYEASWSDNWDGFTGSIYHQCKNCGHQVRMSGRRLLHASYPKDVNKCDGEVEDKYHKYHRCGCNRHEF